MKVMHVTYDMRIGGTEMVIKNIIEGNTDVNIDMSIYCIEAPIGPWGEEVAKSGVSITTHERRPGFDTSLINALRKHIRENNIDILHCHQYTPWVYGALAAAFTKTKVIFTEHGRFYPDSTSWKRKLVNPLLLALTSKVTAISKATRDALASYEFIPSNKVDVIYNGIKPLMVKQNDVDALRTQLGFNENDIILGTIARFDPIKNQLMMINAFADVAKDQDAIYLLLVGDGEMREMLQQEVDRLGINDKVVFTGYIAKPANYLALMNVFLLSSLSEGTSMTLLEAMSLGKPCAVTDAGGNAEVITHNFNGLVADNDNKNAFAAAISLLTQHHEMRENFGKNAVEKFEAQFSAQKMNEAFRVQYNNLMRSVQ
ncbi:N-acetyl-alpha-D-glucosaminyl L-malate synthase [Alteromonas sp. KUL17]|uniref:glycosyltransferase family 4 protein n=1 Tax=Alteromonas sp. KUL17 TaxID=2480796 RepID=UPI0010379C00|nr:glycosyltransferase family 4 protein [Alteromonas sp. KUL17]TAP29471.1 glycosyltransferase [Alteromonas sp. KUL17]GEA02398.1 N-acetyl-alpha-D-glucosaminyl L-malate synthase [Alteromonas sp. KUL17]